MIARSHTVLPLQSGDDAHASFVLVYRAVNIPCLDVCRRRPLR